MRFKKIKEYLATLTKKEQETFQEQIDGALKREADLEESKIKAQQALVDYKGMVIHAVENMAELFEKLQYLEKSLVLLNERLHIVKETIDKNTDKVLELQLLTIPKDKIGKA